MGALIHWLGFQVNTLHNTATLTPDKQACMHQILDKIVRGEQHTADEVEANTGRLQWATMICIAIRPFLQPLYAWKMALHAQQAHNREQRRHKGQAYGRPSLALRIVADTILEILSNPPRPFATARPAHSMHGATDAGADDSTARVGGWYCTNPTPDKHEVHWFSVEVTRVRHPWAFSTGTPQQLIAALELYGTLLLLRHIAHSTNGTVHVNIPMKTDNKGNSYSVTNYKAKKWPNAAILMEIALTDHYMHCTPELTYTPRELNTWADDLTHDDHSGFNPDLQVHPNESDWYILDKLLSRHHPNNRS